MKKICPALLALCIATSANAETANFDADQPGTLPAGWISGVTGRGDSKWLIAADSSAPSKPNVLKQSGTGSFPWCIKKDVSITDGFVSVKFKPISGKEDQAGGVIWRWKDGDDYYVARANALEKTARGHPLADLCQASKQIHGGFSRRF